MGRDDGDVTSPLFSISLCEPIHDIYSFFGSSFKSCPMHSASDRKIHDEEEKKKTFW